LAADRTVKLEGTNRLLDQLLPHVNQHETRRERERLQGIGGTPVLYESPYRIAKLLIELNEVFPARQVVLAGERTKKFEEYLRGTPAELLARLQQRALKGEPVVLVAGEADG
jgi:16S rRNA (cytidine1402-2'-O)-methyltransferase